MKISIIVAVSANNVIGVDGALPWRLADDLKQFKSVTMGKSIIMGRATFESIGRALPGRHSIVLSRQEGFVADGCDVVSSVEDALNVAGDAAEVMVIGGAAIYSAFLPIAKRLYLTTVQAQVDGDTFFPEFDRAQWQLLSRDSYSSSPGNQHPFTIEVLERVVETPVA